MICFLCPHPPHPSGGVLTIYRHADILNDAGIESVVVHQQVGYRPNWFENRRTRVCYPPIDIRPHDVVVLPEIEGPAIATMAPSVKKVIFNQNPYYSFRGYPLGPSEVVNPYTHPEVLGTITVSQDALDYLRYASPDATVMRVRPAIDPSLFHEGPKKRQIAFMPRKQPQDAQQIIQILRSRNALSGYTTVSIDGLSRTQTAAVLRESAIYLSFGFPEGFGLPAAEAMACGCAVVGYHGGGGKEYFTPDNGFPVAVGEIVEFARKAEHVIRTMALEPNAFREMTHRAASFNGSSCGIPSLIVTGALARVGSV